MFTDRARRMRRLLVRIGAGAGRPASRPATARRLERDDPHHGRQRHGGWRPEVGGGAFGECYRCERRLRTSSALLPLPSLRSFPSLRSLRSLPSLPSLRSLPSLLSLLALLATAPSADAQSGRSASERFTRIVGGVEAAPGAWPWQVALVEPDGSGFRQFCGGSVIAPRWVLTAAHCVDFASPDDVQVLVGTQDLDSGGRRIDVKAIRVHEDYSDAPSGDDIALLELAGPAGVEGVALPDLERSADIAAPGAMATAIGWGLLRPLQCTPGSREGAHRCRPRGGGAGYWVDDLTGAQVDLSDVRTSRLMEVELPLVGDEACRGAYPDGGDRVRIDRSTLCAGLRKGGKDSCQGDSGGPLVVRDGDEWVQVGVVSWGASCAKPGKYGVYTSTGAFADWVERQTGLALPAGPAGPQVEEPPSQSDASGEPAGPQVEEPSSQDDVSGEPSGPQAEEPPSQDDASGEPADPQVEEPPSQDDASGEPSGPQAEEPPSQDDVSGEPVAPPDPPRVPPGDRALLIGIDHYANPEFDLRGAVRDVRHMHGLLTKYLGFDPEQVRLLIDANATREAILAGFRDWLVAGTRPGARAVLYFAGHGYYQRDDDGDEEEDGYDEALVPHDARPLSTEETPIRFANLVLDDEVGELFAELGDRYAYLVVDSCYSGTITRGLERADPRLVRALDSRLDEARERSGRRSTVREAGRSGGRPEGFVESTGNLVAWTAVSSSQLALEGPGDADAGRGVHRPLRAGDHRA